MKKLHVSLLSVLLLGSLVLTGCNKQESVEVQQQQDTSKFVQPFNSTESFIKLYSNDKDFDFNKELPLASSFTSILNLMSNNASTVLTGKESVEAQKTALLEFAKVLNTEFQKDLSAYLSLDAKDREAIEARGFSITKDSQLTTLIAQLVEGCKASNSYQPNIEEILAKTTFPEGISEQTKNEKLEVMRKFLTNWKDIIVNTCILADQLNTQFSSPDFNIKALDAEAKHN